MVYCCACFCYICVCVCEGEVGGDDQLWRVPQCPRAVTTRRRHPLLHRGQVCVSLPIVSSYQNSSAWLISFPGSSMPRFEPGNEASAWLVLSILLFYCPCSHRPLELDNVYNQDQVRHMVPYVEPSFSLMGTWIHAPMHTYGMHQVEFRSL